MHNQVLKKLMMAYYGLYTGTVLTTIVGMLLTQDKDVIISAKSPVGVALTSLVVLYTLVSIPLSLGLFHRAVKKWKNLTDENQKLNLYQRGALLRLLFIGIGLMGSIVVFFLQRTDMSLIYCAGISGIAMIFCRPTENKIINDLDLDDEE